MSLVNYYSSSDDENSSGEEETEDKFHVKLMSVDEKFEHVEEKPDEKPSLFATLPAPKSSEIDEQEESDIKHFPGLGVAMSSTSSMSRGLLNLPAPKKRSAQPIKITAPSLPETNSDEEEEEPSAKKAKPAKGLAGFFAMLPKPRNASLKETKRILLPHTLTKKPAPRKTVRPQATKSTPSQPATVKPKPAGLAASYDSDEEDEDEAGSRSFFSLGESTKATPSPGPTTVTYASMYRNKLNPKSTSITPGPVVQEPSRHPIPQSALISQETTNPQRPLQPDSKASLNFRPAPSQDSPLAFKPTNPPSAQDAPLAFSNPINLSAQYGHNTSQYPESQMYTAPYGYGYAEYNQPYQEQDPPVYSEVQGVGSTEVQEAVGPSDLAADKEFQKLMGKRNVGREAINMVEIAADEQIGPTNHLDWLKKNLTEEKEYRIKLRKEQLPSGQQKRKHQITFLAHQAKERELELKNQWANNRQTRKDTQMKYGF